MVKPPTPPGEALGDGDPAFADARKAVYDQDGQFYRYRDALKWSRFNTASAIEFAMLWAVYQVEDLPPGEKLGLVVLVTALLAVIFAIIVVDEKDCNAHLTRIKGYEIGYAANKYPAPGRLPFLGKYLSRIPMAAIFALNLYLVCKFAAPFFVGAPSPP